MENLDRCGKSGDEHGHTHWCGWRGACTLESKKVYILGYYMYFFQKDDFSAYFFCFCFLQTNHTTQLFD